MIERALELAGKRARGAEVTLVTSRSRQAEYEDDRLKHVQVSQSTRLDVRVILDGKLGSAHTTDPEQIEDVVGRAIQLAEFGSDAEFEFPGPAELPTVETYDPAVEKIAKEDLVAAGAEMLGRVKAYNDEIKVFGGASWYVEDRRLVNSAGLDISDRVSSYGIGTGGVLVRGTDMLFVYRNRDWRTPLMPPADLAEKAIEDFRLAERTASLKSKAMPVIFTPRGNYLLLWALLMGLNGKNVLKGDSPLAGRLGETLAPEGFSLVDDATINYAPASSRSDGEGVPRRKTSMIHDGRLECFLYDLETAGKAGTATTGNGPGCDPSNIIIPPGEVSLADMIASTKDGLLVEHVMGLGKSNLMNGDFSVNVSLGYKIENGEIVGRVKDAMLTGNAYDALKRIEAVGSEPEWAHFFCTPPIKIDGLSVVAKG
jgi:PmbA protein